MINWYLRYLLEIILLNKKANYEEYIKFDNISQRTFYRRINDLNIFLKSKKLPIIKVDSALPEKNIEVLFNFWINLNKDENLDLNNYEIACYLMIQSRKNYLKTTYEKKNLLISNKNWQKINFIIKDCLGKYKNSENYFFHFSEISKNDFFNFFYAWLLKYFSTKNVLKIIDKITLSNFFPQKLRKEISLYFNLDFFETILKLIDFLLKKEIAIQEQFTISLYLFTFCFWDNKNLKIVHPKKWILPKEVKEVINFIFSEKNEKILNDKKINHIKNIILEVFDFLKIKISDDDFFELIINHISNKSINNQDSLDEINQRIYEELKKDYFSLDNQIRKSFSKIISNNDKEIYYLIIYFLNYWRSYISSLKLKIYTVCWGGLGMSHILKSNIKKVFKNSEIQPLSFYQAHQKIPKENYDLIFTISTFGNNYLLKEKIIYIKNEDLILQDIFVKEVWKKIFDYLN